MRVAIDNFSGNGNCALLYCGALSLVKPGPIIFSDSFLIRPYAWGGNMVGFAIFGSRVGDAIRQRQLYYLLHKHFPQVTKHQIEHAEIGFDANKAFMVLGAKKWKTLL